MVAPCFLSAMAVLCLLLLVCTVYLLSSAHCVLPALSKPLRAGPSRGWRHSTLQGGGSWLPPELACEGLPQLQGVQGSL